MKDDLRAGELVFQSNPILKTFAVFLIAVCCVILIYLFYSGMDHWKARAIVAPGIGIAYGIFLLRGKILLKRDLVTIDYGFCKKRVGIQDIKAYEMKAMRSRTVVHFLGTNGKPVFGISGNMACNSNADAITAAKRWAEEKGIGEVG